MVAMGKAMAELFASGHIIDLILGLVVVEVAALALWRRGSAPVRRWAASPPIWHPAASCCWRCGRRLVDAAWEWVALALLGSLLAHLVDLYGRRRG